MNHVTMSPCHAWNLRCGIIICVDNLYDIVSGWKENTMRIYHVKENIFHKMCRRFRFTFLLLYCQLPADLYALCHDEVIKWKHFPRYWPFVRGIHRSPVNSRHKGQWRGAVMFSLICAWMNGWVNIHQAGDLRRHRAHYYVTVMITVQPMAASLVFGQLSNYTIGSDIIVVGMSKRGCFMMIKLSVFVIRGIYSRW